MEEAVMTDTRLDTISKEASAWVAKLHGAEPSTEELSALHEWMDRSPEHKAEIRQVAKLWNELNVLTELAVPVQMPERRGALARFFSFPISPVLSGAVACMLLVVLAIVVLPLEYFTPEQGVYSTEVGEQQLITLNDGTTLLLNTNSQARVEYSGNTRDVYLLKGQAHFDVVHNPEKPFRVYAGSGMVRALGTAFSVYLKDELLEVTVTEGSIELNTVEIVPDTAAVAQGESFAPAIKKTLAVVRAGQYATLDQDKQAVKAVENAAPPELSRKLSWHDGLLHFSGDPLSYVVEEVSRYTPLSIVILDPKLRDLRIGGFFKVGETDKMFDALSASFGVKVERVEENLVHLSSASSSSSVQQ
jgi:transmembrane sensor